MFRLLRKGPARGFTKCMGILRGYCGGGVFSTTRTLSCDMQYHLRDNEPSRVDILSLLIYNLPPPEYLPNIGLNTTKNISDNKKGIMLR